MKPLAGPLADYLSRAIPLDDSFDAVVPMPLHWRRRFQRGFNQAAVLAKDVAQRRRIPLLNAVRRVRATATQTGLTNAQRRENVRGAFRAGRGRPLEGLRILLVDDVMTTGATGSACAAALKRAGAKSVTLLTLARVDRRVMQVPEPLVFATMGAS
jgi:ComF family protein